MSDLISRQAAIDALRVAYWDKNIQSAKGDPCIVDAMTDWAIRQIKALPSAQPEIIRCNSCKYWTQSTGEMKGYGLGRCDFHDADLVACNGFCYWAERRTDG